MRNYLLAVVVLIGLSAVPAQAMVDFGVVLNGSMMNLVQSPAPTPPAVAPSAKLAFGGGVVASFNLIPMFNLDAGLIYAARKFGVGEASLASVDYSMNYLEIPVVAKYWILPVLSLNGGFYYASAMGDITTTTTILNTPSTETITFDAAGRKKSDMGLILGVGTKLPLGGMSFIANANYLMGMTDLAATPVAGESSKWAGLELQAGLMF